MTISEKILKLAEYLYPRGRAFRMKGTLKELHEAMDISIVESYEAGVSILDSILPDNDNFTADDATDWEVRLGLITNTSVSLADRKAAILRKMNYPGDIPARQGLEYLQGELRKAGFDVYVWENMWYEGGQWVTQPIGVLNGGIGYEEFQLGDFQLGMSQLGSYYTGLIANSIYADDDATFDIGSSFRCTFFISANIIQPPYGAVGVFANIDANRELELRQLVLKIKPTQTIGVGLINFI